VTPGETILTPTEVSAALEGSAWRYLLGSITTSVDVDSMSQALAVAREVTAACSDDVSDHLRVDLRPDRVELTLRAARPGGLTTDDIELSERITAAVVAMGLSTTGATTQAGRRSVQLVEIAIDAMDIAAIRPFWQAVMGYGDEPAGGGPTDAVVDPVGQGPSIWFQQMDAPRPQRNRIHLDIAVPHDEAAARVEVALGAGGVLVSDAAARAFWVLADVEGNEICVCTWQDRS
jgi:4a-hydroxytetrahydrobiopterin dehydratase